MQHESATSINLKRSAIETDISVKKFKTEDKTEGFEGSAATQLQARTRPIIRGVERIFPYPAECRPSQPYYEWHRRHLVKDVTERMAYQGRRVVGLAKFLDDGIVFDWILDRTLLPKKTVERTNHSQAPQSMLPEGPRKKDFPGLQSSPALEKSDVLTEVTSDATAEALNDLHFATSIQDVSEDFQGSLDDPVVISEGDYSEVEATRQREIIIGADVLSDRAMRRNQRAEVNSDVRPEDDTPSEMDLDSDSTSSSGSTPSAKDSNSGLLSALNERSLPHRSSYRQRPHFQSSGFDVAREVTFNTGSISKPFSVPEQAYSLRDVNWDNYRSIIFLKNLPREISVEDVYAFMLNHGFSFQSIKKIIIHYRDKSGDAMPSVEFYSPIIAQEALAKLRETVWQPSASSTSTSRSSLPLRAEPCQRPKWYTAGREQLLTNRVHLASNSDPRHRSSNSGNNGREEAPSDRLQASGRGSTTRRISGKRRTDEPRRTRASLGNFLDASSSSVSASDPSSTVVGKSRLIDSGESKVSDEVIEIKDSSDVEQLPGNSDQGRVQNTRSSSDSSSNSSSSSSTPDSTSDSDSTDGDTDRTVSVHEDSADDRSRGDARRCRRLKSHYNEVNRSRSVVEKRMKLADVVLPKVPYGRPRRILLPLKGNIPITTVSMRGDCQFIDPRSKIRLHSLSLPATEDTKGRVEDACMLGDIGVVGFSSDRDQVALLAFSEAAGKADVRRLLRRAHDKRGISCLAPIPSSLDARGWFFEFLSGGFDKFVKRWRVTPAEDLDDGARTFSTTVEHYPREHNSTITSVAWHEYDTTVLSAAGAKLWTTHAERRAVLGSPSVVSNLINHIHVHPTNPNIVILEVAHPYAQVQVFDIRQGYSGKPIMTLGYADTSSSATGVRARHRKGDTTAKHFVRGFDDGTVALWDYRNPETTLKVHQMQEPVYHTVFVNKKTTDIWAFAGNLVNHIGQSSQDR